ncbi:MAG: dihydrodipicolinate synthase family protein, partial [Pseudomonadota bacterium]
EAETRRLNELLMPLNRKLFLEANPIPVKWALYDMGLIPGGIRLPLTILAPEYQVIVHDELRKLGLVDA